MTPDNHDRKAIAALLAPPAPRGRFASVVRWSIGAALILGLTIAGASTLRTRTGTTAPRYVTEIVKRGNLAVRVSATGKLQPTNTVEVGSELSGLVVGVFVQENDAVKKGQLLARLDTSKLQDAMARSEASLASAEAKLAQADATKTQSSANLARLREVARLSDGRVPSKTEMETAEATLARAEADRASQAAAVSEARAALSSDRTNLAKASIVSPIDGIVLTRSVEPGQTVAASLQVATLFKIAQDLRQMQLKVDIDEADVGRVAAGQQATFTVDAYANRRYTAGVIRVAYGSTTTGDVVSYGTLLTVRNDDLSLRPGMTASADIATASVQGALLVPNSALRYTPPVQTQGRGLAGGLMPGPPREPQKDVTAADGTKPLWVLRDGAPAAARVVLGQTDGRFTEIVSGDIQEGAAVITDAGGVS